MSLTEDDSLREMLDSSYSGLSDIPTRQCEVYMAAMSAVVGEIALVEVEDAQDVRDKTRVSARNSARTFFFTMKTSFGMCAYIICRQV